MLRLAEEVFAARQDPQQLDVNEQVLEKLQQLHPASVSERSDASGPYCWILLIPTTRPLMEAFLSGRLSERELCDRTVPGPSFDCLYLCSAMVLTEYRHRGIARETALEAIRQIRERYPITCLFVWPFTPEGDATAQAIARAAGLPLLTRPHET